MKYPVLLCIILFLSSCTDQLLKEDPGTEPCPAMICTQEFRSIVVIFKNSAGSPISVKNFTSLIRRTGKTPQSGAVDTVHFKGNYAVVTDGDTKNLLSQGDTIDVSAVNPGTNQKKTAQFVVSGGKCACHIEKLSGPETIVFD
ncbi:hypothetical protein ACFSJU_18395 [Paradesertivirga mongoliensis]|uniref:Uncharacterized protein n=1 Tax=Paradesertivirga mongoliensis TaxID=2100740 RepID=A0ABW4ZS04_9SPHI|nr:hypothetical protein [Pedobacter mongoliensis]